MTAQQLFLSVSVLELKLERLDREYDRMFTAVTRCTVGYEPPIQSGKSSDRRYDALIELSRERDETWDDLIERRRICHALLDRLDEPGWAMVMECWYLDRSEPDKDKIAERLGVDRSTVYRMHTNAIRALDKLIRSESA